MHAALNTRSLFLRLLRILKPGTVCDIGSMDGAEALRFRQVLPHANILAFEANPRNYALMQLDSRLQGKCIQLYPYAVSDTPGSFPFHVVDANYAPGRDRIRRGVGSLYPRFDASRLAEVAEVTSIRLDEFLASRAERNEPLALWIDVEGKAFEAIRGAEGVLDATRILHVEVESEPLMDPSQKTFEDVHELLLSRGFRLVATDKRWEIPQFDALYIDARAAAEHHAAIGFWIGALRMRYAVARLCWRILPAKIQRLLLRIIYRS